METFECKVCGELIEKRGFSTYDVASLAPADHGLDGLKELPTLYVHETCVAAFAPPADYEQVAETPSEPERENRCVLVARTQGYNATKVEDYWSVTARGGTTLGMMLADGTIKFPNGNAISRRATLRQLETLLGIDYSF